MARMLIVALVALTPQLALAKPYCVAEIDNVSTASWDLKMGGAGTNSPTSSPTYLAPDICKPVRPREEAKRARGRGARRLGDGRLTSAARGHSEAETERERDRERERARERGKTAAPARAARGPQFLR